MNTDVDFSFILKKCRADGGLAPTEGNDDGIVGGPRTPQQIAAQKRLQQTQAQVDEVSVYTQLTAHTHMGAPLGLFPSI